jgi:hypothetical protein
MHSRSEQLWRAVFLLIILALVFILWQLVRSGLG